MKWRGILLHTLVLLLMAIPALATISSISGFTTQADGNVITASIWNNQIGSIYTYINNNLVASWNKATTKGDIWCYDGAAIQRLGVGSNGQTLTADSTASSGLAWSSIASTTALTTKGDLCGYDTALTRVPVGSNGQVLTADSAASAGVSWQTPATIPSGIITLWSGSIASIPSGWHLCDGTTGTPNLQGLFVAGAGNVSPAATGGMGLVSPGGPFGDNSAGTGLGPSHTHSEGSQNISPGTLPSTDIYGTATTGSTTVTPKYYALAYIMKL